MNDYPSPCDSCTRKHCLKDCTDWKIRYLYRQKQINAYAKRNGIMPDSPVYEPGRNPCDGCKWQETCDSICVARAKYWDDCTKEVREAAKNGITDA